MRSFAHGSNAEAKFRDMAESKGWSVTRAGWPDFLLVGDGGARFVEVKSAGDRLSDGQVEMFSALELAGIAVLVWWELRPDVLTPWRVFHELTQNPPSPPKTDPLPKRRPARRYNPRKLGTLERDRQRGIGSAHYRK